MKASLLQVVVDGVDLWWYGNQFQFWGNIEAGV